LLQVPQRFEKAAVVSDSEIASLVGAEIMRKGGNAIDAAVAVGFALAVTLPAAGNIGGGGFMVVRMADGKTIAIDYRETAPATGTRDMYKEKPGDSLVGPRAAGVPGTVAGMAEAHRRFGKLPWKALVEPSVRLATEGFVLPWGLAEGLSEASAMFKPFPASYAQFNRSGKPFKPGETFAQPDLGKTLARIADKGPREFYEGETAKLIAACGTISLDDLKTYKTAIREPLTGSYKGYDILTMPPPSSGGIAILQMLQVMRNDDLKGMGFASSDHLHLTVETMKRAFADRSVHLGDPDFETVPVKELLSLEYADRLRRQIGEKATPSAEIKAISVGTRESEQTTHYSVVDDEGNAVSNTYTLNGGYGSGFVVPGAGFLLNNEMDDFATQPGKPNMYGLIQGPKNEIKPGKRPLSSMTPTIVTKDGKLVLVLGSPGGPTIINTVLQCFLNVTEFGMNVQRAVSAPRIHHQWMPDEIRWESFGLPRDVKRAMEAKGHKFESAARTMGSCHAISVSATGVRQAGVDPRVSTSGAAGF
jgi:gamma-glutamyltranspeptidase/glutathione hydrolase